MSAFSPGARWATALVLVVVAFGFYNHYRKASPHEPPSGLVSIGEITAISGSVEHRWPSRVEMIPVAKTGSVLHAGELVRTGANSQALVTLKNGTQLKIPSDSQFVAEFDATKEGAVRGTVLSGSADITKAGPPESFRLFREGRDITRGRTVESIVIPSAGSAPTGTAPGEPVITAMTPVETPTPATTPISSTDDQPTATGSLGNDEIRKSFGKNTGFFQRCYLSHLSRKGMSNAHRVVVGFNIQPSGKITGTKIVRSDFDDATLNNCVVEAVERTSMRPFSGEAIEILEFPVELN